MQFIPKDRILEHLPDTFMTMRKEYKLDKPGEMKEAIRILREWIEKQEHFMKKDFSDYILETTIVSCKGSIERAKARFDRMCTYRTLFPQFFGAFNVKTDFGIMFDVVTPVMLPKLTPDHYRVFFFKINHNAHVMKDYICLLRFAIIISEYIRTHDYCRGFYIIADFMEVNLMEVLPNINPILLRQAMSIYIEGYGMRLKGMYIFTPSKLVDSFVSLMKQVCSPKIADRIHSYKSLEKLHDILPSDILPSEYGGTERSLKAIFEEWMEILSSKEHMDHLEGMNQAKTDESYRQSDEFNEQYAGVPGTFRMLNVD